VWQVNKSSKLKTALVVVGGTIVATPVAALELGDVRVHSSLGQPLRASIAYALAPDEAIADTCVSLLSGPTASGLPSVSRGSMIVTDGVIAITGTAVVREPLLSMRINVNCPYTPQLTREYMLFVDPADAMPQPVAAPASAPAEAPAVSQQAAVVRPAPVRSRPVNDEPIVNATRYLVRPGDSLSEIAQRIEDRPIGLWPAVNAIFAANPDAFIDNDVNKLKAGSWLDIPDFSAGQQPQLVNAAVEDVAPVEAIADGTAYEPAELESAIEETPESPLADLQPGDIILDSDTLVVTPVDSVNDDSIVIPDTQMENPVATSSQPNVPVAVIQQPDASDTSSTNWLVWFLGGGLALIAGLLFFGRFRDRFGSTPIAVATQPQRRRTDGDTAQLEAIGDVDFDFDLQDTDSTAENIALDADLLVGTGLTDGTDVDVAPDFAFASTTSLDLELPEEMSSGEQRPSTDIIPPLNIDPDSILENEVLPDDEDDDYDMSVIVDATKMPNPDEVTERDLEAIAVPDDDGELITGDYTVSQEVDNKILEQDYEDEMTATQALNQEIQKAAEELATRMSDDDSEDDTKEMSLASVHELDVTVQMRGGNDDDISDDDDTGVNPTVNLEADDKTVEMRDDSTVEMPKKGGTKAG